MNINRLDHLVLTVNNIEATCSFYKRVLGMEVVVFGGGRKALTFGAQKSTCIKKVKSMNLQALNPTPGQAICVLSLLFLYRK